MEKTMSTKYDAFLDFIGDFHKKTVEADPALLAYEFYLLALVAEEPVEAEFLYLKAIDLWIKSGCQFSSGAFSSIAALADGFASQFKSSRKFTPVSIQPSTQSESILPTELAA